jgi:hypothetical protein
VLRDGFGVLRMLGGRGCGGGRCHSSGVLGGRRGFRMLLVAIGFVSNVAARVSK